MTSLVRSLATVSEHFPILRVLDVQVSGWTVRYSIQDWTNHHGQQATSFVRTTFYGCSNNLKIEWFNISKPDPQMQTGLCDRVQLEAAAEERFVAERHTTTERSIRNVPVLEDPGFWESERPWTSSNPPECCSSLGDCGKPAEERLR